jgi:general secretion pathway protein J
MIGSSRGRADGFILVEAIAVLALSGLVLVALVIASGLVARNSSAVAMRANETEVLNTGLSSLERDLAAALPVAAGAADSAMLFQGSASSVGFVKPADLGGGRSLVWIAASTLEGKNVLMRSYAALSPEITGFGGASFGHPVVMLSGSWTYRFAYGKAGNGPMQWTDNWADPKRLPDAVQLQILDAGGARKVSPLTIALHVLPEGKCDPSTEQNCKSETGGEEKQKGADGDPSAVQ